MRLFWVIGLFLLAGCSAVQRDKEACQPVAQVHGAAERQTEDDRLQQYKLWADDASITAAVKYNFSVDAYVKVLKIHVETRDGVVHLTGFVDRPALVERAGTLAGAVKGVKTVNNALVVLAGS